SLRFHVPGVLLDIRPPTHAAADDVQHGENSGLGAVDDLVAEFAEIAPAGAAGVHYRGDAAAERKAVGADAVLAQVFAAHAPGECVYVNVDQAGSDIERRDID